MRIKGIITLFFVLLAAIGASARQHVTDTTWYYMHYSKIVSTKDSANAYMAILPVNDSGVYPVLQYDKDHRLTFSGFSTTSNPNKLSYTGAYTDFYENGKPSIVANFDNGKPSGKIMQYYPNGQLYTYRIQPKNGHILLIECRDSTGKVLAKNGSGHWIIYAKKFKKIDEEGTVQDSLEDGKWAGEIDHFGSFETMYDHGNLTSHSDDNLYISHSSLYPFVAVQPYYPDFGSYLAKSIRYPKYAKERNIQGKVFVQFVVERDGRLVDIKVLRSPDQSLSDEAVRVIQDCSKWQPGIRDDELVRVMYTVPINFTLTR
jgi:TonB family protein